MEIGITNKITNKITNLDRTKLNYYAYGQTPETTIHNHKFEFNRGIQDSSSDILHRNCLSLNSSNYEGIRNNYKKLNTLDKMSKETNNYLHPLKTYKSNEKYPNIGNHETFNIEREKQFANDRPINLLSGNNVTMQEFKRKKHNSLSTIDQFSINVNENLGIQNLKDNQLCFDKTANAVIRYPKGYWQFSKE
jgi:hypothetical protein